MQSYLHSINRSAIFHLVYLLHSGYWNLLLRNLDLQIKLVFLKSRDKVILAFVIVIRVTGYVLVEGFQVPTHFLTIWLEKSSRILEKPKSASLKTNLLISIFSGFTSRWICHFLSAQQSRSILIIGFPMLETLLSFHSIPSKIGNLHSRRTLEQ